MLICSRAPAMCFSKEDERCELRARRRQSAVKLHNSQPVTFPFETRSSGRRRSSSDGTKKFSSRALHQDLSSQNNLKSFNSKNAMKNKQTIKTFSKRRLGGCFVLRYVSNYCRCMMNGCGVATEASKLHDDNLNCTFMRVYFRLQFLISEVESIQTKSDGNVDRSLC